MATAPFRVKALYEYSSPHEDDLSFPPGAIITVTEQEDDDWYGGEYLDDAGVKHEGIFPRNFVEKIEPQAPPRPTRTRTKRESDIAPAPAPVPEPEPVQEPELEPEQEPEPEPQPVRALPPREKVADAPQAAPVVSPTSPKAPVIPTPAPIQATEPEPTVSTSPPAAKPPPSQSKPAAPPPVSSKPSNNAFRDRIAAFNKPAAAPITPFKPSGLGSGNTGFIKKPFVAPPPSRNAYIPPVQQAPQAKLYRREEDPDIKEQEAEAQENAERAGFTSSAAPAEGGDEDQPKPTSLKERIALLQKQQLEQAQRHAEAATKKTAKRPPKKRTDSHDPGEGAGEATPAPAVPQDDHDTDEPERKASLDSERLPPPPRRKSSKGPAPEPYHDGNEADMSGAGDTTEGPEELTERDEVEERPRRMSRIPTTGPPEPRKSLDRPAPQQEEVADEEEEEEDEEDEEAAEYRRKEELRMRMMKMSGGMGMGHMFGAPPPGAPPKKKKTEPKHTSTEDLDDQAISPTSAPPVPVPGMGMMALPGLSISRKTEEPEDIDEPVLKSPTSPRAPPRPPNRPVEEEEDDDEPLTAKPPTRTSMDRAAPPPIPGGRPVPPPPVPAEARAVPPPPPADAADSEGSESDEDVPGAALESRTNTGVSEARSPPPLPPASARAPPPLPPVGDESPQSPGGDPPAPSRRLSRLPPPIPGAAPALPPAAPGQTRPPPPPPPGGALSRQSTQDFSGAPPPLPQSRPRDTGEEEEEVTEYEGDYDTDIASSVPHKDALKSHARESSLEDNSSLKSPVADAPPSLPPPIPSAGVPRAVPPPIPSLPPQSPPLDKRRSVDVPRAAPPPPPPGKETPSYEDEDYDPFNYSAPIGGFSQRTPKIEEEPQFPNTQPLPSPPPQARPPPPAPPGNRGPGRQSVDLPRASTTIRRSMDIHRPSIESGFIANDIDLAAHNGWWRQPNQVPPVLQGRKDLYFEAEEVTSTQGSTTIVTRTIYILFQDYSQTILTIVFDPYDQSDVELDQRHEPPPRQLRQDELEQAYERFGRAIASSVASKKDSVVADGTPQSLVFELLRPFKDALAPIGTRAYGALVYANLANASTQQNDEIRPGDIVSIRNAKFQGKHGPMHAKYTAEVGKPDHVGIVAEWDGTKKKVRAWEQGRENKKVKMESFKLDDLRSGEVKVWRVMPRSWVGWNSQP